MAAHDDKISNNRRRLFKALSAAPVVMTLRPGSALATASAYQCLVNEAGAPADFHDAPTVGCGTGETCYAYQKRSYWDVAEGTKVPPDADTNTWPDPVRALLGVRIIDTQSAAGFVTSVGDAVDAGLLELYDGNTKLRIKQGSITYIENIPTHEGLALVLVEPLDGGTSIDIAGVFPEKMQSGNLQGITGTCLASIHPGASGIVIARG